MATFARFPRVGALLGRRWVLDREDDGDVSIIMAPLGSRRFGRWPGGLAPRARCGVWSGSFGPCPRGKQRGRIVSIG